MNLKRTTLLLGVLLGLTASADPQSVFTAACEGKAEKSACSVALNDGDHEGVCRTDDRRERACMPRDPPAPPASPPQHAGAAK
ncbi:MAG: hypothetical protein IPJ65_37610 [Archangiaceae bacterium]|nr:hypothetical protein [Archangiaceae bacterium]